MKLVSALFLISFGFVSKAQLPTHVFYADEFTCSVFYGVAKKYILHLYPDSSATFSVHMQQTGDYLKGVKRNEVTKTGVYTIVGDTVTVTYQLPTANKNLKVSQFTDSSLNATTVRHSIKRFLLDKKKDKLTSLDRFIPELEAISLVELNQKIAMGNK